MIWRTKKLSSDNKRSFKKRVKRKIGVEVKSKVKSSKPWSFLDVLIL